MVYTYSLRSPAAVGTIAPSDRPRARPFSLACSVALQFVRMTAFRGAFRIGYSLNTCLVLAVHIPHLAAVRFLIEAGADVTDSAPFHAASHRPCAILLLAAGADVNQRDRSGAPVWPERTLFDGRMSIDGSSDEIDSALDWWEHLPVLLAAGVDLDAAAGDCLYDDMTLREFLAQYDETVHPDTVEYARREIAKTRLDFVRYRALQVCIGLQSLRLNALQTCEILVHACGPVATLIAFHQWWKIATTVKHFKPRTDAL